MATELAAGKPAAIARGITWCETGGEKSDALQALLPTRTAHVIGLTGSPGTGKSTLLNALVKGYAKRGTRVAIMAVDPSSPLTGGALLADRVRLESASGSFFRSLASRGAAGGLCDAAWATSRVLSAAGYPVVLIETVGAGQSEVKVMRVADTVMLVLMPGSGDEMQALKSGIMEIADIYVLNKADQPGINELKMHVKGRIGLRENAAWKPPIVLTTAREGQGTDELLEALERHREFLHSDLGRARAAAALREEASQAARSALDREVAAVLQEHWDQLARDVESGRLSGPEAARDLARRAARRLLSAVDQVSTGGAR